MADEQSKNACQYILESPHETQDIFEIPGVTTLPELLTWQAQRRGDAALFSFRSQPGASLTTISYGQAHDKSVQLANTLYSLSLNPESSTGNPVVGIWFEKSIELHLAIFASTISGAAWLPFDADAPAARVATCLGDSKACSKFSSFQSYASC
jgi:acyl-CoA synthetase (AMP-forming)/AMP-acid ligase II